MAQWAGAQTVNAFTTFCVVAAKHLNEWQRNQFPSTLLPDPQGEGSPYLLVGCLGSLAVIEDGARRRWASLTRNGMWAV